jgi:hypothetical protein
LPSIIVAGLSSVNVFEVNWCLKAYPFTKLFETYRSCSVYTVPSFYDTILLKKSCLLDYHIRWFIINVLKALKTFFSKLYDLKWHF